jgi:hypothetical protein
MPPLFLHAAWQTGPASRSATGDVAFYQEESGYNVVLSRLSDGQFGTSGSSGLGGDGNHTVMPSNVTPTVGYLAENVSGLQFVFSGFENSGTAYREVDVTGIATPIPEPSFYGFETPN